MVRYYTGAKMPPPPPGLHDPEVKGQVIAMRAFEIALAGNHPIGVVGCIGSGRHYLTSEVFPNVARAVFDTCPCGNKGSLRTECRCTPEARSVHYAVIEPVLLELDIIIEVTPVPYKYFQAPGMQPQDWENFRTRVRLARIHGEARPNLELKDDAARRTMELAVRKLCFTCQQYVAVNRVARTIACLAGACAVEARHVAEAAQYLAPAHPCYWER